MATFSLQKSKKLLEAQGYACWIVEKPWNQYTKRREDMYHLMDVVGIREDRIGVLGISACGEDVSDHIRKVLEGYVAPNGTVVEPNPYLSTWLKASNSFFIWGWRLRGKKGKRKLWQLREIEFIIENGQVVHRETNAKETEDAEEGAGDVAGDSQRQAGT